MLLGVVRTSIAAIVTSLEVSFMLLLVGVLLPGHLLSTTKVLLGEEFLALSSWRLVLNWTLMLLLLLLLLLLLRISLHEIIHVVVILFIMLLLILIKIFMVFMLFFLLLFLLLFNQLHSFFLSRSESKCHHIILLFLMLLVCRVV